MPIRYLPALPQGAELVIIGGGIVGAATAFHASRAGLRPLLLERRPALCSLTTAVAAGGVRLQLDTEEQLRLVRESAELFAHFAEVTGQAEYRSGLRRHGYLWLTTSADGAERQRRLVAEQRGWGVTGVELLSGDEARRAFPFVGPEVVQARYRAEDGLLDPKGVTLGLAAASGAQVVVGCEVVGLRCRGGGGRVVEVETTLGRVGADAVVVAAGPFSGEVARLGAVDAAGRPLHDDARPPAAHRQHRRRGPAAEQRLQRPWGDGRTRRVEASGRPAQRQDLRSRQSLPARPELRRAPCLRHPVAAAPVTMSGKPQLAGLVVLDQAGAGRAVPVRLELCAALQVLQGLAVAGALGAPLGEQPQRAGELTAGDAELVGEARRALRIGLADHQPPALERLQPLREHVGGNARQLVLQVVEAPGPGQQGFDQQQRPAVTDADDRLMKRRARVLAGRRRLFCLRHGPILRRGHCGTC